MNLSHTTFSLYFLSTFPYLFLATKQERTYYLYMEVRHRSKPTNYRQCGNTAQIAQEKHREHR